MKCNEYNTYSVLCQGCDYPDNIKCCKKLDMRDLTENEEKACYKGMINMSENTGLTLFED